MLKKTGWEDMFTPSFFKSCSSADGRIKVECASTPERFGSASIAFFAFVFERAEIERAIKTSSKDKMLERALEYAFLKSTIGSKMSSEIISKLSSISASALSV